jgi:hypothetical protein
MVIAVKLAATRHFYSGLIFLDLPEQVLLAENFRTEAGNLMFMMSPCDT